MRKHDAIDQGINTANPMRIANYLMMSMMTAIRSDIKKLLLLGTGYSGKSTIFRQLKYIYSTGFDPEEIDVCKWTIRRNVVDSMLKLLRCAKQFHEREPDRHAQLRNDEETYAAVQLVVEISGAILFEVDPEKARRLGLKPLTPFCALSNV